MWSSEGVSQSVTPDHQCVNRLVADNLVSSCTCSGDLFLQSSFNMEITRSDRNLIDNAKCNYVVKVFYE